MMTRFLLFHQTQDTTLGLLAAGQNLLTVSDCYDTCLPVIASQQWMSLGFTIPLHARQRPPQLLTIFQCQPNIKQDVHDNLSEALGSEVHREFRRAVSVS